MTLIKVQFRRPDASTSSSGSAGNASHGPNQPGGGLAGLLLPEYREGVFGRREVRACARPAANASSGGKTATAGSAEAGATISVASSSVHPARREPNGTTTSRGPSPPSAGSSTASSRPSGPPSGSAKRKAGLLAPRASPFALLSPPPSASHASTGTSTTASTTASTSASGQTTISATMHLNPRALHDGVRMWGYKGQGNDRGALDWGVAGPAIRPGQATSSTGPSPPVTPRTKHKRKAALASQAHTARLIRMTEEGAGEVGHVGAGTGEVVGGKEKEEEGSKERPAKRAKKEKEKEKERGGSRSRESSPVGTTAPDPAMKRTRSNGSANLHIPASLAHAFPPARDQARRSLPPPSPLRASAVPVFQEVLERGRSKRERGAVGEQEDGHAEEGRSKSKSPRRSPRRSPQSTDPTPDDKPATTSKTIPPIILRRTVSQDPSTGGPTVPAPPERTARSNSLGDSALGLPGAEAQDMARSSSANGRTRRETTMPRNLRDYDTKITA